MKLFRKPNLHRVLLVTTSLVRGHRHRRSTQETKLKQWCWRLRQQAWGLALQAIEGTDPFQPSKP